MEINYLIPVLSVVVQLVCAYLYISAYRLEGKKNVLASVILAFFAIFTTLLTPYLDSRKAEVMLNKQAEMTEAAVVAGTTKLNKANEELRLAQEKTQKAVEALRQSQHEVKVLHGVINEGNMQITKSRLAQSAVAAKQGVAIQKAENSPMLNNPGNMSVGGSVIVGGKNHRITTIGEQPPTEAIADDVSGLTRSSAHVEKGQRVRILASGSIKIGGWAGTSQPEGRSSGFAGGDLSAYSIVSTYNHAALLYRVAGEADWLPYGQNCVFRAQRSGNLEFQVNDREQGNNSGSYKVTTQLFAD
jgi:hypothetical protein